MLEHHVHRPGPPLDRWIAEMWYVRSDELVAPHATILPDGSMLLFVNLGGAHRVRRGATSTPCTRAWVVGTQHRWIDVDFAADFELLGIRFQLGGGHQVFGDAVGELADRVVELEALWPGVESLRDRISAAATPAARFAIVEATLIERARADNATRSQPVVGATLAEVVAGVPLSAVARHAAVTPRHLRRRFVAELGMSPKQLAKLARFRRALDRAYRSSQSWAAIAAEVGYYDQAHLIRDFQELGGMSPGDYRRRCGESIDEVPG